MITLCNMQAVKKEPSCIGPYGGEDALVLAVALQGTDRDLVNHKLSTMTFKNKSTTCRRKREFIPHEKKDNHIGKGGARTTKQPNVHEKSADSTIWFWRTAHGPRGRNASLKAELLSLKLRFGLVSSAAYAQEVQNISSSTAALYQDLIPASPTKGSYPCELEPARLTSSHISVIKHSPHSACLMDPTQVWSPRGAHL